MTGTQMTLEEALRQAISHHQAGRLAEAENFYRAILQVAPNHPDANHNLGVIAVQAGQLTAGLTHFKAALDVNPDHAQYLTSYVEALIQGGRFNDVRQVLEEGRRNGLQPELADAIEARIEGKAPNLSEINAFLSLFNTGRLAEAEALARTLTEKFPEDGFGWKALGAVLKQSGRYDEALESMRKAAHLLPRDAEAHNNLGVLLRERGQLLDAEEYCRQAIGIQPDFAKGHYNLGLILKDRGQVVEAGSCFERAIELSPDYARAYFSLGEIQKNSGMLQKAESSFRKAAEADPKYAEARYQLANTLKEQGRNQEAVEFFQAALAIRPDYPEVLNNLGLAQKDIGRFVEAEASFRRAVELRPDFFPAQNNLGVMLCHRGESRKGIEIFREALAENPNLPNLHGNLIFYMDMLPEFSTRALQEERRNWAMRHADPLFIERNFTNSPDPDRRIHIGYVSGDFNDHSAAYGFASLLGNYERKNFEVYAYSNSAKFDALTERLKSGVTRWRDIQGMPDEAAAELIVRDSIDILVDLSGFSAGNRLLVFARKPAPIQVSAMGYPTGTGMRAMDAIFSDPVVIPPAEAGFYVEEIRYLRSVIAYGTSKVLPEVNELPALAAGEITFGSFNRLSKVSKETLDLWARLLNELPGSRLVVKAGELDDEMTRNRLLGHITAAGIAAERIGLLGKTSWFEHLQACHRVDISLDPIPHGGGVTTIESIRMGVPVLTLRYPTFVGRASASILTTLGLTDWIAESPDEYVKIAIEKSKDLAALAKLRGELRGVFDASILGDPDYYVRAAEKEYRALWREWCAKQPGSQ